MHSRLPPIDQHVGISPKVAPQTVMSRGTKDLIRGGAPGAARGSVEPQPPSGAAKAETAVSIASLRETIHAAMGDVAADAVLPAV